MHIHIYLPTIDVPSASEVWVMLTVVHVVDVVTSRTFNDNVEKRRRRA